MVSQSQEQERVAVERNTQVRRAHVRALQQYRDPPLQQRLAKVAGAISAAKAFTTARGTTGALPDNP